ncbi:hypothetical protein [Legionella fairfieldensis]|uniref:hypothetical protein n=1 Tax=Legionella fairfieldensis TaxID=45064 RepID=UPI0010418B8A|nr:hypothetical protein [Legionella fairfieldensis]
MLTALFVVRTVNLSEIAVAFSSKAEKNSRYKRLQRFFAQFKIDYTLIARLIPFYIRIKEGSLTQLIKKKLFTAKKIFNDLKPQQHKVFNMAVEVFGQSVFLVGSRSEKGELMIIATNQHPKKAIPIYLRRWEIECLFSALKKYLNLKKY